ncbi:MAG: Holliday junction resolvase RuvX, partial [Metamycoplasmataceae bacterium]
IALDLGTKKCGIAMTDPLQIIAQPLEVVFYEAQKFEKILARLQEIKHKQGPIEAFILGNPLMPSGDASNMSNIVNKFKIELENNLNIPVILFDERYSSKQSTKIMIDMNMSRLQQKKNRDKFAAQIILENYLLFKNKQ